MAKILISGIGGGQKKEGTYRQANYEIEGKIYEGRTFITSALEEHYGIDKTIYIGTTGSMWDNLYEHYCNKYGVELNEDYAFKLLDIIDRSKQDFTIDINELDLSYFNEVFAGHVEGRVTQYGINEEQIFENFNIIMDLNDILKDGDELYLDITHSFRSNAMWMFLVMNYINDVVDKNIEIKGITYGMLEISGANKGVVPVVDLNAFYKLLKWIKGANNFKNYGNSYMLLDLVDEEETRKKLRTFSCAMNMNYIGTLKQNIESLKRIQDRIEDLNGPGKILIPEIVRSFLKEFGDIEKDYIFQVKLAKWHFKHKRYALSFFNINESIKGYIEDELRDIIDVEYANPDDKEKNYYPRAKEFLKNLKYRQNSKVVMDYNKELREISKMFEHTRVIRNDIAHSLGEKQSAINDIESLRNYCDKIMGVVTKKGFIKDSEIKLKIIGKEKIKG